MFAGRGRTKCAGLRDTARTHRPVAELLIRLCNAGHGCGAEAGASAYRQGNAGERRLLRAAILQPRLWDDQPLLGKAWPVRYAEVHPVRPTLRHRLPAILLAAHTTASSYLPGQLVWRRCAAAHLYEQLPGALRTLQSRPRKA